MRDFKVLRQRHITRRFHRVVERRAPRRVPIEVDHLDLLLDLDPAAAYRAMAG